MFRYIDKGYIQLKLEYIYLYGNKPAAQAAGADPSQWSSTIRQNPPVQQNLRNFWTNTEILMAFKISNLWKIMILFVSWLVAPFLTVWALHRR